MTVQADSQTAPGDSGDFPFDVPTDGDRYVLAFEVSGSPTAPPFTVTATGLTLE